MKWIKNSALFHIFLLIMAAAIGYGSYRLGTQALGAYRESTENKKKIEELMEKKHELEAYLERLQAPGEIERQAKERLNLKLPGEHVVVVLAQQASSTRDRIGAATGRGLWDWLRRFLSSVR